MSAEALREGLRYLEADPGALDADPDLRLRLLRALAPTDHARERAIADLALTCSGGGWSFFRGGRRAELGAHVVRTELQAGPFRHEHTVTDGACYERQTHWVELFRPTPCSGCNAATREADRGLVMYQGSDYSEALARLRSGEIRPVSIDSLIDANRD